MKELDKFKSFQVKDYSVLDKLIELISCYTRDEGADIIVDTIHLEDEEHHKEFLNITGLTDEDIDGCNYILLWK
jgi:hypothetical protein